MRRNRSQRGAASPGMLCRSSTAVAKRVTHAAEAPPAIAAAEFVQEITETTETTQGSSRSQITAKLIAVVTTIAFIVTSTVAAMLPAQVLTSTPHCGGSAIDLCVDLSDDSLWVVDQLSGEICHYMVTALPANITFIEMVPHTFGAAGVPTFEPRVTGVAYNAAADSLFVLNRTDLEVQQIDKSGGALGAIITLTPATAVPALFGLSYDDTTSTLWTFEINAELLVQYDLSGNIVSTRMVPSNVAGESLFGAGLQVDAGNAEVAYGDTLDFGVAHTIEINSGGNATGREVDLSSITENVLGIARRPGANVLFACSSATIYELDAQDPPLLPPHLITCSANSNGSVSLTWQNGGAYNAISIIRDTTVVTTLTGASSSYTDLGPPTGQSITYTIRAFGAGQADGFCQITTGPGGRIDYTPFAGTSLFDLAYDAGSDLLYVTDSQSLLGSIYVYDASSLLVVDQLDTGLMGLQAIAFDSVQNRLAVTTNANNLVSFVDPVTGIVPASFPAPTAGGVGSLTFDADTNSFSYVDLATREWVVVDADPAGPLISTCTPPFTSGIDFAGQVADLDSGSGLLSIASTATGNLAGLERYDVGVCFESVGGAAVTLDDLGGSLQEVNGVTGIERVGALVYLAGAAANSIFRVILDDTATVFIRGDADRDADVDIADVIVIANALFADGGAALDCLDAADTNDDGLLDISDPVYLIFYEFLNGPMPPEPFPAPGVDPTADLLDC